MNYLRLLKWLVPFWAVTSAAALLFWGERVCCAQSLACASCAAGVFVAEFMQKKFIKNRTEFAGLTFLSGALPRMGIPVIFLIISLKFYHNPIDKITQFAIIGSYFVYYPLVLAISAYNSIEAVRQTNLPAGTDENKHENGTRF